jgi:hypothetical protein
LFSLRFQKCREKWSSRGLTAREWAGTSRFASLYSGVLPKRRNLAGRQSIPVQSFSQQKQPWTIDTKTSRFPCPSISDNPLTHLSFHLWISILSEVSSRQIKVLYSCTQKHRESLEQSCIRKVIVSYSFTTSWGWGLKVSQTLRL